MADAADALPEPREMRMESVGSHAFKKLGAVAIAASLDPSAPSLHYESAESWAAQSLSVSRSLLASSGESGWMFLVAPGLASDNTGRTHGLLYARSADICAAIEEDVAAQEEEAKDKGEEGPSKKTDLPLSDKVFKFLPVEGSIWHITFNRTSDFLCVCTLTHILLYSLHSVVAGDEQPYASLEMDQPMRDVAWSSNAQNLELGVLLVTGVFRVYEIKLDLATLQCTQQFNGPPVSAIVSGGPHPVAKNFRAWFLGFADGSLQMLDPTSFPRDPLFFPPHLPPDAAEGERWGIHSLSYLPLSSDPRDEQGRLVVGYSIPQEGDDFGLRDPTRVHVSVLNTDTLEWFDFGDVLRDEEKCNVNDEADRLYEGRHRFHVAPIPDLSLAVFGSSKAAEVTVLGVLPEENPAQHPVNWWFFEVEADQIVVPMDSEFKDTYALGFAIDTTNRVAPEGPAAGGAASSSSAASNAGLFPAVFMLTTNARLHVYHLTTSDATHLNRIRALMRPAVQVPSLAESIKHHQFFSTMLPPGAEQQAAAPGEEEGDGSGGSESEEPTQPPSPDSATPPFTPSAAPQPKPAAPAAAIPALPPAAASVVPDFDFSKKSGGTGFEFKVNSEFKPAAGAGAGAPVLPDAAPTFGGFSWAPPPAAAAAAVAPKPAVAAPPAAAPAAKPAPASDAAAMPPPAARTARKNLDFTAPPTVSASPVLSAKGSPPPASFEPAPLQGEIPQAARSALPQPTATGSMTRSIIKPPPAAAAAPSPPADPFAPSNFGIDYTSSSPPASGSEASALSAELSSRAKKATAVDYKALRHPDDVGTDTERKFMEALMTVAINFKHVTTLAHESREALVAAQSAPAKPAPGHEMDFSLKSLRTLTSRTRTLMSVASSLQESEQKSAAALQDLVEQSHRDEKVAATCSSLLKREQDPDYQELLQSMTLDVHSARMQQAIDTTTTKVLQQISALETHLHDLYTLHHASTGAPASLVTVPTIAGVAGVVNKHGRSIEELEDLVDDLAKRVEHLQANPPPLSREQRRAKREKQRESGGALEFSPIGRNNSSMASDLATPETKEEKEDAFTTTPKRTGTGSTSGGTPFSASRSASSASSFRASSLSVLNDSFQSKLKRSAVKPNLSLRPSLSREASIAAISRGKSKQRLDQLFAAVDTPGLQNISPLQPEEELQESRMDSAAANTRRWARSGGDRGEAVSPVPLREVTSSDSDDSDDEQPLVLNVTAPPTTKPTPVPIKLPEPVAVLSKPALAPAAAGAPAAAAAAAAKPAPVAFTFPSALGTGLPASTSNFSAGFALPASSPLLGAGAAPAFPAFSALADAAPAAAPVTELKPKKVLKEKPKLVLGEPAAAAADAALPPPIAGLKPAATPAPAAGALSFGGFAGFGSIAPFPAFGAAPAAAVADADDSKLPPPAALIAKKSAEKPALEKPALEKPADVKPIAAAAAAPAPAAAATKPAEAKVSVPPVVPVPAVELPKMSAAAAIAAAAPKAKDSLPAQSDAEAQQLKNVLSLLGPSGERDAAPSPEPGEAVAPPPAAAAAAPAESKQKEAPPAVAPLVFPSLSLPAAAPLIKPAAAPLLDLAAPAPAPAAAAAPAPAPFSLGAPASFGLDFAKALPGAAASGAAASSASSSALPTSSPSMAISATPLASPFAPTPAAAPGTTPSSTNLFGPGSAPVTGGLFGSLSFGGAAAAAAPAAANTGANLFAMPPSTAGAPGAGGMGLFGSAATSLLPSTAAAPSTVSTNLFATPPSGNIFGGAAPAPAAAANNPFAPAASSGFPPSGLGASGFPPSSGASSNPFAPAAAASSNPFAPAPGGLALANNPFAPAAGGAPGGSSFTSNVFGNAAAQQQPAQNNPFGTGSQGGGPFAQPAPPSGPFGPPAHQQAAPASGNPFSGSNPLGVGFGQQSFGVQGPSNSVAALAFGGGPGGIGTGIAPSFGGGAAATGAVFGGGGSAAPVFGTSSFGGSAGGGAAAPAFGSGSNVFGGGGGGAPQSSPFGALAAGAGSGGGFPQPAAGANPFGGSGFPAAGGFPSAGSGGFPNFANQGFRG